MKDRWQDRRRKSFNWTKVIIMLAALVAILYVMSRLSTIDNINWQNNETATEAQADSVDPGIQKESTGEAAGELSP